MSIGWPDLPGALLWIAVGLVLTAGFIGFVAWDARRRRSTSVVIEVAGALARIWVAFTGVAMVVSVWGLLTALVLAHMPVGKPPLRQAGALAARSALFGAPVMVALFLLFPRIGPLWGVPQDALGRTGLSGTLRLGGVAEIANDDSIALRVRFDDGMVAQPASLYFRGPVLSRFDGIEWRRRAGGLVTVRLFQLVPFHSKVSVWLEPL